MRNTIIKSNNKVTITSTDCLVVLLINISLRKIVCNMPSHIVVKIRANITSFLSLSLSISQHDILAGFKEMSTSTKDSLSIGMTIKAISDFRLNITMRQQAKFPLITTRCCHQYEMPRRTLITTNHINNSQSPLITHQPLQLSLITLQLSLGFMAFKQ